MHTSVVPADAPHLGLVLTGGGARSAYQVGVLKGVAELLRRGSACPFPIITGTSAGAVSAIALASDAAHFRRSVYAIERVWRDFRVHQVFKADAVSMLRSGLHWMLAFITGGWLVHPPHSLFDNTPLWDLLREQLDFDGIPRSLYKKHLQAIGVCATCYADADSVTFYASASHDRALGAGVSQGRAGAADAGPFDGEPVHSLSVPAGAAARPIFRRRRHAPDLAA